MFSWAVPSIWRCILPHHHRLGHGVYFQPVVGHLRYLVPWELRRISYRLLECRLTSAVRYNVKPVAVAAVLGHTPFVRREQDRARGLGQPLDLDESQFAGVEVQAGMASS